MALDAAAGKMQAGLHDRGGAIARQQFWGGDYGKIF